MDSRTVGSRSDCSGIYLTKRGRVNRGRDIEVLKLAQRISAELESGRVDDVDMDDETLGRVGAMLAPPTQIVREPPCPTVRPRLQPGGNARVARKVVPIALGILMTLGSFADLAEQLAS